MTPILAGKGIIVSLVERSLGGGLFFVPILDRLTELVRIVTCRKKATSTSRQGDH
jgi:hypothetical protein